MERAKTGGLRHHLFVGAVALAVLAVNSLLILAWLSGIWMWSEIAHSRILDALDSGPQATLVFDRTGAPLFSFYTERRIDVPLSHISTPVVLAVLAAEDQRFFMHPGFDGRRIAAAAVSNIRKNRIAEGGSTITQQLVRNVDLNRERTFGRKAKEILLAVAAEQRYSKRAILQSYLNRVYFGEGFYGIEAAARGYFGKSATALDPAEAATLAGLIKAPTVLSPLRSPEKSRTRRNHVLSVMRAREWIGDAQYRAAVAKPLSVLPAAPGGKLPDEHRQRIGRYFREEIRRQLIERFGEQRLLTGGLRVHTTLDVRMQRAAERVIEEHAASVQRRRRGGDGELQASLVAIEPRTGAVLAMVGGRDFDSSQFNRATQARRQPGSAFKPLIYAAALERGWTAQSTLENLDQPIHTVEGDWLPGGEHEGMQYTLRHALTASSNRAAVQLLQAVGVSGAVDMAHRLGIRSELPPVPSLALGSGEVTLLELTSAYSAFANAGMLASPVLITRIEDAGGAVLWENRATPRRVLTATTAFLMSHILRDVIQSGTGAGARTHGFKLPAAGKTGTTNDYADSWFIGYTPKLVTGVWFGFDQPQMILKRGFASVVAVPAWAKFMAEATRGDEPLTFEVPSGVDKVAICSVSRLRATDACRAAVASAPVTYEIAQDGSLQMVLPPFIIEEYFSAGTVPVWQCLDHLPGDGERQTGDEMWRTLGVAYAPRDVP